MGIELMLLSFEDYEFSLEEINTKWIIKIIEKYW